MNQNNTLIKSNDVEKNQLPLSLLEYITSNSIASQLNEQSRIGLYENWLLDNDMDGITNFDLVAYKNFLMSSERKDIGLSALSRASAAAHINSIRARYLYMLDNAPGRLRDFLYTMTPQDAPPSDRKAYVDEMQLRIRERVQDKRATVQIVHRSDETDDYFIRLSLPEMLSYSESPLNSPQNHIITGTRDSAMLTLLCMTGLREDELVNLDVEDLYKKMSGYPALEVRRGKGAKQRVVPYGEFHEVIMERVELWLKVAKIQTGAIFRGLTKWGTVRKSRISKRAINDIVGRYPANFNGKVVTMKPHDCRRSYARILRYEFEMPIEGIAKNLGHNDTKTTQGYIGDIDISHRIPTRGES